MSTPSDSMVWQLEPLGKKPCPVLETWNDNDHLFTKLFRAWDGLPAFEPANETSLLLELDQIIPAFDAYIGHSDEGFRAWVRRHQWAMEQGYADIPTWPKLYKVAKGGIVWQDKKWEDRYAYLIRQRSLIATSRLEFVRACDMADTGRFFGTRQDASRQTLPAGRGKPMQLGNLWYLPLNALLVIMSYTSAWKPAMDEVQRQF